jgi:hypothetical protein
MATKTRVSVDDSINYTEFLSFTGVQSAANAFLQIPIATPVSPSDGFILDVQVVDFNLDSINAISTFSPTIDFSLTRASKAAIPNLTDLDVIAKGKIISLGAGAAATGSAGLVENPVNRSFTGKQVIAATTVYFQFQTTGFAGANTISGRIYYKQIPMSKDRILEILYG